MARSAGGPAKLCGEIIPVQDATKRQPDFLICVRGVPGADACTLSSRVSADSLAARRARRAGQLPPGGRGPGYSARWMTFRRMRLRGPRRPLVAMPWFLARAAVAMLLAGNVRATSVGTVCVEHLSRSDSDWAKGSMRKVSRRARFQLTVDRKPPVEISARQGAIISDLDPSQSHRVEVRLRHKPYARFSLSFEGRNFLRVRFEPFYGEWHVAAVDPSAGCSL
jgi:hypothetical protein